MDGKEPSFSPEVTQAFSILSQGFFHYLKLIIGTYEGGLKPGHQTWYYYFFFIYKTVMELASKYPPPTIENNPLYRLFCFLTMGLFFCSVPFCSVFHRNAEHSLELNENIG